MSKHAIIVIKNDNNEYLQYFDNRWNSFLFPNCKLDENFNEDVIKDYISIKLKINNSELECIYVADKVHTKFSESARKEKEYHHYFYKINIESIPEIMRKKSFNTENTKYCWYSEDELKNDERIQKVNSDIVQFIKEYNL